MSLVAYGTSSDDSETETLAHVSEKVVKRKQKVKIAIPSLKEFEEDEIPKKKPKVQSGSGLLGLLPPPKNMSTITKPGFMPHILKSKNMKQMSSSSVKQCDFAVSEIDIPSKIVTNCVVPIEYDSNSDVSHEDDKTLEENLTSEDFFSLNNSKNKDTKGNCTPSNYLSVDSTLISSRNSKLSFQPFELQNSSNPGVQEISFENKLKSTYSQEQFHQPSLPSEPEKSTDYSLEYSSEQTESFGSYEDSARDDVKEPLFCDEGFIKLQGRRHELGNVSIIDVNAADQLTDRNQWLMKSLTEESTHRPSRKKHEMPTRQQKHKHQITYLAFQAKEREMDLKNQWALNSRTRRETQAKYGF